MASGTISMSSTASDFVGRISYSTTANTSLNTTTVTLTYQLRRTGQEGTVGGNASGYSVATTISSSNEVTNKSVLYNTGSNLLLNNDGSWLTVYTSKHIITHSSNGTAAMTVTTTMKGTVNGVVLTVKGVNVPIPQIVSQAYLTSAPNFGNTDNPTIGYYNPMGNSATSLSACISFTGALADIPYRSVSKTGTSYTFNLTAEERETLISNTSGDSRSVRFILRMVINGETYYSVLHRTFSVVDIQPTLNPTVVDNNATTVALTGDNNKFIRYYSDAAVTFGAEAKHGATITSKKCTCGNKSITSDGTIYDVENGTFVLSATDSRGTTVSKTLTKTLIPYVKVTCNQSVSMVTDGDSSAQIELTISGNFYNANFGAKANSLKLYVRHSANNGAMGDWVDLSPLLYTTDGNTYSLTTSISGFDPSGTYTFQCKAVDALGEATTGEYAVKFYPVFDWDKDDFNFNVPIHMHGQTILRHNETANNIVLSATGGFIYFRPGGTNSTSTEIKITPQGNIEMNGSIIVNGVNIIDALKAKGII